MTVAGLLLLSVFAQTTPDQVPNPRKQGSWVSDLAEVLPPDDRAVIDSKISALERDLGVEIAVVTVQEIDRTPREFATALMERWHVGKAAASNGLILLLVLKTRRFSSEVGYGLEPILTDSWLGAMQAKTMVPRFKAGDYEGGLRAGLDEIIGRIRQYPDDAREGARNIGKTSSRPTLARSPPGDSGPLGASLFGATLALGAIFLVVMVRRSRQRRRCKQCQRHLHRLTEAEEDKYLSKGQQSEEDAGSVDYDVFVCETCKIVDIRTRRALFTRYRPCASCGFRTVRARSLTTRQATTLTSGEIQITETCHHCHAQHVRVETIAAITAWSSSGDSSGGFGGGDSSSSSSDFGGGDSGGGGADSSY